MKAFWRYSKRRAAAAEEAGELPVEAEEAAEHSFQEAAVAVEEGEEEEASTWVKAWLEVSR